MELPDIDKLKSLLAKLEVSPIVACAENVHSADSDTSKQAEQELVQLRATSDKIDLSIDQRTSVVSNGIEAAGNAGIEQNGGVVEARNEGSLMDFVRNHQLSRAAKNSEEEIRRMQATPKQFDRLGVNQAILDQMKSLPIFVEKDHIVETIKNHQIVLVMGETGSGKSTQIPQYLVEAGFVEKGQIGITQPRRVAAKSLAERVSTEVGSKLGDLVGYQVRFDKATSSDTIIKYMTDGLLVREFSQNQQLDGYSVIIIDEAHERRIGTDVCFGLLKRAAKERSDLRIVISSATMEVEKFSKYFDNAPIIKVDGDTFPVEQFYEPRSHDYVPGVVDTVLKIHSGEPAGDVLVFLPGQDEIEKASNLLETCITTSGLSPNELHVVQCYGSLSFEEQQRIFEDTPAGCRKVVLATNIAETSLTIEGIVYVIDCGYYKENQYNPETGMDSLVMLKITEFQAIQRAGRAGRTQPGKCYRLYSELERSKFKKTPLPEIQRCNIENIMLTLIGMGVSNPLEFPFMDAPKIESIAEALEHLEELGALDANLKLTTLGQQMSEFPLDPPLAKSLIVSAELGCSAEVLVIVALLSTQYQNLFYRSKRFRDEADERHAQFIQPEGEHSTLLRIYLEWQRNDKREDWCRHNLINYRQLVEADEIRVQLKEILHRHGLKERSCGMNTEVIHRAFTAGFFRRLAKKGRARHTYETVTMNCASSKENLYLHPSSALFKKHPSPEWLLFHEVMKTSKPFILGASVIKPEWVREYAPAFADKINISRPTKIF